MKLVSRLLVLAMSALPNLVMASDYKNYQAQKPEVAEIKTTNNPTRIISSFYGDPKTLVWVLIGIWPINLKTLWF